MTVTAPSGGGSTNAVGPPGSDPNYTAFTPANSWEAQLLTQLNLPITKTNVEVLDAWAASEGTINSNNPLAISGNHPGATKCLAQCGSSSPVMAYSTLDAGVTATANFLKGSYYTDILKQMQLNNYQNTGSNALETSLAATFAAINASPWCKGCQGGKYPVALANLLNGIKVNFQGKNLTVSGTTINETTPDQQGAVTPGMNWTGIIPGLGTLLSAITSSSFWRRILTGFMGLAFAIIGITLILSENKTVKQVGETAAMASV